MVKSTNLFNAQGLLILMIYIIRKEILLEERREVLHGYILK